MENLAPAVDQTAAAGWNPGIGGAESASILDHNPLPAPNGEGQATTEPPKPAATLPSHATDEKPNGTPAAQCAAAAKAPAKATRKPLLDPEKYRKAKAPAAEEAFSDGAQTTIPVRKPGSRNFFRVHPDEECRLYNVPVVEDEKRETYILAPDLEIPEDLERFVSHVNLVTCLNHKGTLFLWPYKNSTNDWSKSASRIVRRAVSEWVRLRADMDANGYRVETAPAELRAVEPTWPKMTFEEILNTAFEDKCIDSLDHPVIRSLRGLGYGPAL
jgi:hypothetical protein